MKNSVKILNYEPRINSKTNETFFVLLVSALLPRLSATGKWRIEAKTVTVPTPMDQATCQSFIGERLPGTVKEVPCDPYEWKVPSTGKVEKRSTTWMYVGTTEQDDEQS